ncbi:hypothetical protein [Prevotellamassilia timonensis]|uniref:hypothetical protein n=1 Tax=Prevotellamassilia timonensis TaxID=1852370 RepID=UPI001F389440|nr:hypothetical protein [Prevotellamassilia timonensis]MCF2634087.1 hypothetical protein [Prevotellamassilia timonensis]
MANIKNAPHVVWMFYGILLYEIAGLGSLFFSWSNYLCMLGVIITIIAFTRAPKLPIPVAAKVSVTLLYATIVFMVCRGSLIGNTPHLYGEGPLPNSSMYDIIRFFLVNPYSTFAILFPFVILVDWRIDEFMYLRKIALVSSFASIVAYFVFKDYIALADEFGRTQFANASGFVSVRSLANQIFVGLGAVLCMSWSFQYLIQKKIYWILLLILFLNFFCHVSGGGRGNSVIALGYILLFFLFLYNSSKSGYIRRSKIRSVFAVLFVAFVVVVYYLATKTSFLDLLISRTFEGGDINAGLRESSREEYMGAMIQDFNTDFLSWIFGRGVNGCYSLGKNNLRSSLEWGYMWLILKGGVIYLVLYVYILIKAFANGYRKSKNALARSLGFLCLVQVLLLVPFGLPTVSIQCLLVWHSVRLLNSPTFLNLSDSEVHRMINK